MTRKGVLGRQSCIFHKSTCSSHSEGVQNSCLILWLVETTILAHLLSWQVTVGLGDHLDSRILLSLVLILQVACSDRLEGFFCTDMTVVPLWFAELTISTSIESLSLVAWPLLEVAFRFSFEPSENADSNSCKQR